MNEFCTLVSAIQSGDTVTLEKGRTYHVRQDDSYDLTGYFCSNTASQAENPTGQKTAALYLTNKKDIVIDGNGATLLIHGKMTPFLLDHCENITIKNLTVDYACPTMAEFTVLEQKDGVLTIRINEECLFRPDGDTILWYGETGLDGKPYWEDRANSQHGQGGHRIANALDPVTGFTCYYPVSQLTFTRIEQLDSRTLRCTLASEEVVLPAGAVVQTRNVIRDQVGAMFQRCKNLTLENLRIQFMHGLGMVSQFCENVTYKNCDLTPKEGRTITSTADFFHFSGCRGLLTLDGCKVWGAQDDPINVHGTYLQVTEVDREEKTMLVRFRHYETWGFQAFEEGDELEFIRWDTLIPYAGTQVIGWEKIGPAEIRLRVTDIPDGIILGKDVVENASWTADVHVLNCYFGPTAGRGILCTSRGKVIIENNLFETLRGPALVVGGDCNFWFESGGTREIVFRNNEVVSCNYGKSMGIGPVIQYTPKVMNEDSTEFVHGRLIATGNKFMKPLHGSHSFCLEYLREAVITDNTFDAPYEIHTKVCGNVVDENNTRKADACPSREL